MVLCGIGSQYPDLASASRRISICHSTGKDSVWTDVPENSSTLEKLHTNPAAFAIFSCHFLDQNNESLYRINGILLERQIQENKRVLPR